MLSESTIIHRLKTVFASPKKNIIVGIGDDAAIIRPNPKKHLVYTCDTQVEGTHFLTQQIQPKQLGFRAMSAAVSDLAAMGATPTYCLVSFFLPKRDDITDWIGGVTRGIKQASTLYDITVIGGNIAKAPMITIDIFAVGEINPGKAVRQNGAKEGDIVMVTGTLGNAHSGWRLLQNPDIALAPSDKTYLLKSHFCPSAKIKEGHILAETGHISSMIDISDGLSTDLLHLCVESNTGVRIFADSLPVAKQVKSFAKATETPVLQLAFQGGEDYQLVCTTSPQYAEKIIKQVQKATGTPLTIIGTIEKKRKGRKIVLSDGKTIPLIASGYDHLR